MNKQNKNMNDFVSNSGKRAKAIEESELSQNYSFYRLIKAFST